MSKAKKDKEIRYILKTVGRTLFIIETYEEEGTLSEEGLHRLFKDRGFREHYITPGSYIPMPEGKTKRRARA